MCRCFGLQWSNKSCSNHDLMLGARLRHACAQKVPDMSVRRKSKEHACRQTKDSCKGLFGSEHYLCFTVSRVQKSSLLGQSLFSIPLVTELHDCPSPITCVDPLLQILFDQPHTLQAQRSNHTHAPKTLLLACSIPFNPLALGIA